MEAAVLETLMAERQITRVILRYARAVDGLDFDALRSCFHPEARISYGDFFEGDREQTLRWLENALPRLQSTLHDFGPPLIELDEARKGATVDTYATNSARYPENAAGEVVLNVSGVRYLDRFEFRGGEWRIRERRNVAIWSQNTVEVPAPQPPFVDGGARQR